MRRYAVLYGTGLSVVLLALLGGCSSDAQAPETTGGARTAGGPVAGPADMHCMGASGDTMAQVVDYAQCNPGSMPSAHGDMEHDAAAGELYGAPMCGTQAADDDCKYHLAWSSTPIYRNHDVTITLALKMLSSGAAVAGAPVRAEVFLDDVHPAPNTGTRSTERAAGTYDVGPIRFDAPGRWTVRFHFFEECTDAVEDSPHGHASFYVDVP